MKICNFCGLENKYGEIRCWHCGHQSFRKSLHEGDQESQSDQLKNTFQKMSRSTAKKSTMKKETTDVLSSEEEIKKLSDTIADLRQKGKKAVASRDNWKNRAKSAESKVKELERRISRFGTISTENDTKFQKIKTKFANMYHPDKIIGSKIEKIIKQEIFKEFWAEIENIEKK